MAQSAALSVIIPVYNVEAYLHRCVDSVIHQSEKDLEILLIDDGSTDNSGAICDEYAERDARIRVMHKKNGGLSSARNAGLDAATGTYVAFVDSDDYLEPEAYETMLSLAREYDVGIVCAGRYNVDGVTGERTLGLCPAKQEKITTRELVGRIFRWDQCDSSACDKLYLRSLFEGFRYPEGRVCEDVPVTYRIVLQEDYAVTCNQPFYNYYQRPGSITKSAVSEKSFHFSQNTEAICADIQANYPELLPQASYCRVRSLSHILLVLEKEENGAKGPYAERYRALTKALKKYAGFVLHSPYFGKQERATDLLLMLGLYGSMQRFYHFIRRSKS